MNDFPLVRSKTVSTLLALRHKMGDFPAETYDPATFVTPEKPNVGRDELIAAAHVIHDLLKANDISHGFLGGFALMLAGNLRTTKDLDCCFEVANKAHLRGVLEQEARHVNISPRFRSLSHASQRKSLHSYKEDDGRRYKDFCETTK